MTLPTPTIDNTQKILKLLGPNMPEATVDEIMSMGEDAKRFAIIQLSVMLAKANNQNAQGVPSESTPSGCKPNYLKPNYTESKHRAKKRGKPVGSNGGRRATPEPTKKVQLELGVCPNCGGNHLVKSKGPSAKRTRIIEDIPSDFKPEVTEYELPRYYCPDCHQRVEPKVPDALPQSMLGNRLVVMTAWLHYIVCNTLEQIVDTFAYAMKISFTGSALTQMWSRIATILKPWYESIRHSSQNALVLHADETSWRVNGVTYWLWCFATSNETCYLINRHRSSEVITEFFQEEFQGVLVSDFYSAYNAICGTKFQKCLVHLLRELKNTSKYKDISEDWPEFNKRLKRIIRDGIRLWRDKKPDLSEEQYTHRCELLEKRMDELLSQSWTNCNAKRLQKRLLKYRSHLFTYLYTNDVPFDNNFAERSVRPAVLQRKNSGGNRSENGAETQSLLMSIFRTIKQRGGHPVNTVVAALSHWCTSGILPEISDILVPDLKK